MFFCVIHAKSLQYPLTLAQGTDPHFSQLVNGIKAKYRTELSYHNQSHLYKF